MTQLEVAEPVASEAAADEMADTVKTKAAPEVRLDGGTQPRERLDEATVARYAEAMTQGLWDFSRSSDRPVAFDDGNDTWLADGFHRQMAASRADMLDVFSKSLEIRQGTVREAILYAAGANARHGFPRSNDDKRRAVSRLLQDPEWSNWSDRDIARRCYVDHCFVGKLRRKMRKITGDVSGENRTYTTRHGTRATMKTRAIGRKPRPPAEPAADPGEVAGERADDNLVTITPDPSHDLAEKTQASDEAANESQVAGGERRAEVIDQPTTESAEDQQHIPTVPAVEGIDEEDPFTIPPFLRRSVGAVTAEGLHQKGAPVEEAGREPEASDEPMPSGRGALPDDTHHERPTPTSMAPDERDLNCVMAFLSAGLPPLSPERAVEVVIASGRRSELAELAHHQHKWLAELLCLLNTTAS